MSERFEKVQQEILHFRNKRNWAQYHDPKNLAEAISIESSELLENFLWKTVSESKELNESEIQSIKQEIADIFIYLIYLCDELSLDLLEETTKKLKINEERFSLGEYQDVGGR